MTKLDEDPRTKGATGLGMIARIQLSASEDLLLDSLGANERISKYLAVTNPPGFFALSDHRAIHIGIGRGILQSFDRPLSVTVRNRGFFGVEAVLTGAHGEVMEVMMGDLGLMSLAQPFTNPGPDPATSDPEQKGGRGSHPTGEWRWHKTPVTWEEAEQLAADHMRHLGYQAVTVTPSRKDGGIDVVAQGAAAQVKFHATPSGSPDIQALIGAALDFPTKLFYATEYTPDAKAIADARNLALFRIEPFGGISPVNRSALNLAPPPPPPPGPKRWYELEDRVNRCLRWNDQITAYTRTAKISNSDRRAQRDLQKRQTAMIAVSQAMDKLALLDNPTYKEARRIGTVREAEKLLRNAAKHLGLWLT